MKRIDLLGASGAGKSTTFHMIVGTSGRKQCWLTPKEAKAAVARQHMKQERMSAKNLMAILLLGLPLFNPINTQVSNYLLNAHSTQLLWDNAQIHNSFLEIVLKGASCEERDSLHRLLGINWFVPVYRDVLLMENSSIEQRVVFDESLSQKVYGITNWKKGAYEEITAAYFNNMPLPAGLVHLKLDCATAFDRLKERQKLTTGQRNLTQEELIDVINAQIEIASIGASIIKSRGVKVLELESESSIAQKSASINGFIAEL